MPPLVYRATRLQLVATRQGALRCLAFGRVEAGEPEVMVGQLLPAALDRPPETGLFRLWAGRDARGQPVYEDDAVLQVPPARCAEARKWFARALTAPTIGQHSFQV